MLKFISRILFSALVASTIAWPASAADFMFMPDPLQQPKPSVRYSGIYRPEVGTSMPGNRMSIHQENLQASAPVWKDEQNSVVLSAKGGWTHFGATAGYPLQLYDYQFGASYTNLLGEGRFWGLSASFGSASDHPFADSSVDTISATATYGFPQSPVSRWLILMNYSNNRTYLNNVPIFGFAYSYNPSPRFRLTAGLPFAQIWWQFDDHWGLTAFVLGPWVMRTTVGYIIGNPATQAYVGFESSQQTFLILHRIDSKDRFHIDEKKIFVGFKSPLNEVFSTNMEAGYAFARRIFSAENYTGSKSGLVELDASWFAQLGLNAAF